MGAEGCKPRKSLDALPALLSEDAAGRRAGTGGAGRMRTI
jgi:hypothetical protein